MNKKFSIVIAFFLFGIVTSYAQQTVFDLVFYRHSDGCLTIVGGRGHRDIVTGAHRNDTVFVNSEINRFNNLVRQLNAISIEQHRAGARAEYVFFIESELSWIPGEGTVTLYHYNIFRISSGGTGAARPATSTLRHNPATANFLGYNFLLGMPFGLTVGSNWFYLSFNLGTNSYAEITGIEITAGYSFELIDGLLRMPVGLGFSPEMENTGVDFVGEAGLQLLLFSRLYLLSTVRFYTSFRGGLTIGIGFFRNK